MYNNDLPNRSELPGSKQLLRSTLIAAIIATVLLVTVVLPSEYGVDPTRMGRVLGLTPMGEIKMKLAEEAKRDRAASNTAPPQTQPTAPPTAAAVPPTGGAARNDSMTVTIKPGEGVEIKLDMAKGSKASYEWTTTGGGLNFDLHGDNTSNAFISYKKGANAATDSGELIADFDGSHGWFWRNRGQSDVIVTLKATGAYTRMKRVA